jgi:hypothetical protein
VVNWDNQELGFVTAASTRGSAVGRFRAAGPSGDHVVKLYTGWQGQAYLNYEQSPVAALPRPQFTFHTTPGGLGEAVYAERYQAQPIPRPISRRSNPCPDAVAGTGRHGDKARRHRFRRAQRCNWCGKCMWAAVSGEGFTPKETSVGETKAERMDASNRR